MASIERIFQTFEVGIKGIKHLLIVFHLPGPVIPVLKNKRYSINKVSKSEFIVSIFDVTFEDGGNYTCSHYDNHTTDRTVEVTVVGEYNVVTESQIMLLLKSPKI